MKEIIAAIAANRGAMLVAVVLLLTLPSMGPTAVLLYGMHTESTREGAALQELIQVQRGQMKIYERSEENRMELAEFLKECVRGTWDKRGGYDESLDIVGFAGAGWPGLGGRARGSDPDAR